MKTIFFILPLAVEAIMQLAYERRNSDRKTILVILVKNTVACTDIIVCDFGE
jgi:hypothetical protein